MKYPAKGVYFIVFYNMTSLLLFVAAGLFITNTIASQPTKVYVVKAGEIPAKVLPAEAQYVFPIFKEGTVYLRDGSFSRQQLNYNILLGEMHFIGTRGDTLAIDDPATVKQVLIDSAAFYYDRLYLQIVLQVDSFKLAVKEFLYQSPYRTKAAYDVATATSAITTYGSISSNGSFAHLQVEKDVQFIKGVTYFISDRYNHFFKADKKSFFSIFIGKKNMMQDYIKEKNIDFAKRQDLENLLKFCGAIK